MWNRHRCGAAGGHDPGGRGGRAATVPCLTVADLGFRRPADLGDADPAD